jgi:hypothetical protein
MAKDMEDSQYANWEPPSLWNSGSLHGAPP